MLSARFYVTFNLSSANLGIQTPERKAMISLGHSRTPDFNLYLTYNWLPVLFDALSLPNLLRHIQDSRCKFHNRAEY